MSNFEIFVLFTRNQGNQILRPTGFAFSGGFQFLILSLAALTGCFFDQILTANYPGANVQEVICSHSLSFFLIYYMLRLSAQQDAGVRLKPYLLLPVNRTFLALAKMSSRLFNISNLIFAPFTWFVVYFHFFPGEFPLLLRVAYAAGSLFLLIALDWSAQLTREAVTIRPWLWSVIVLPAVALLIPPGVGAGRALAGISITLFCAVSQVTAFFPTFSLILVCGIGAVQFLNSRSSFYLDHRQLSPSKGRHLGGWIADAGSRAHRDLKWTFLVYEWHLIWRQKRTRQLILLTTPASWLIGAFFLTQRRGGNWRLILASFATLMLANSYGLRLFGWEGRHFTGLLAWPQHDRPYLLAKVALLRTMILLSSPPLLFSVFASENRFLTGSFLICFWSACPYLFIIAGLWNRQYMSTSQGALSNYQGVDLLELGSLPLMTFLVLEACMALFFKTQLQSWINLSLSAALLGAEGRIGRLLAGHYKKRKYSLFQAFRLEHRDAE